MSGWEKVAAATAVVVVFIAGANLSMWRRMRLARTARAGWTEAMFDAAMIERGCDADIAALTRTLVAPYYGRGVVPKPDDGLRTFLAIDPDDLCDLVEEGWSRLHLAAPSAAIPEEVPELRTVCALAFYLARRRDELGRA